MEDRVIKLYNILSEIVISEKFDSEKDAPLLLLAGKLFQEIEDNYYPDRVADLRARLGKM